MIPLRTVIAVGPKLDAINCGNRTHILIFLVCLQYYDVPRNVIREMYL